MLLISLLFVPVQFILQKIKILPIKFIKNLLMMVKSVSFAKKMKTVKIFWFALNVKEFGIQTVYKIQIVKD